MSNNQSIPVTAVVLTSNESDNIARCLKSLLWCGEISLIDDSTDDTVRIAKVIVFKPQLVVIKSSIRNDFAYLRNLGLKKAKYDWVLFVDADEEVSSEMKAEISTAIKNSDISGYYLKRQDYFLNKWLKHGETGKTKLLKLGKKHEGYWTRNVPEIWQIKGQTGQLINPLFHYPHLTIAEFLSRINRWTDLDAQTFYAQGKRVNFWQIIIYPAAKFILNYFIRSGFLDGMPGLIMALMMSFHSFLTRGKIYALSNS